MLESWQQPTHAAKNYLFLGLCALFAIPATAVGATLAGEAAHHSWSSDLPASGDLFDRSEQIFADGFENGTWCEWSFPDCTACIVDADCDDGLLCNGIETCDPFLHCQEGVPLDCDDGVACTDDGCDENLGSCVHQTNHSFCDDGRFCNGAETCDAVLDCQPGAPVVCAIDPWHCTDEVCTEFYFVCESVPNHSKCDQGLTPPEFCLSGSGEWECQQTASCTNDSECDDSSFCNGQESCHPQYGYCIPGTPVDCDDGVACTNDRCNETTDSCEYVANNAFCDDGRYCNGAETCDLELDCQPGSDPCGGFACDELGDSCE